MTSIAIVAALCYTNRAHIMLVDGWKLWVWQLRQQQKQRDDDDGDEGEEEEEEEQHQQC